MADGDVWAFPESTNPAQPWQFTYLGNVFSGTVRVDGKNWSGVKDAFRK